MPFVHFIPIKIGGTPLTRTDLAAAAAAYHFGFGKAAAINGSVAVRQPGTNRVIIRSTPEETINPITYLAKLTHDPFLPYKNTAGEFVYNVTFAAYMSQGQVHTHVPGTRLVRITNALKLSATTAFVPQPDPAGVATAVLSRCHVHFGVKLASHMRKGFSGFDNASPQYIYTRLRDNTMNSAAISRFKFTVANPVGPLFPAAYGLASPYTYMQANRPSDVFALYTSYVTSLSAGFSNNRYTLRAYNNTSYNPYKLAAPATSHTHYIVSHPTSLSTLYRPNSYYNYEDYKAVPIAYIWTEYGVQPLRMYVDKRTGVFPPIDSPGRIMGPPGQGFPSGYVDINGFALISRDGVGTGTVGEGTGSGSDIGGSGSFAIQPSYSDIPRGNFQPITSGALYDQVADSLVTIRLGDGTTTTVRLGDVPVYTAIAIRENTQVSSNYLDTSSRFSGTSGNVAPSAATVAATNLTVTFRNTPTVGITGGGEVASYTVGVWQAVTSIVVIGAGIVAVANPVGIVVSAATSVVGAVLALAPDGTFHEQASATDPGGWTFFDNLGESFGVLYDSLVAAGSAAIDAGGGVIDGVQDAVGEAFDDSYVSDLVADLGKYFDNTAQAISDLWDRLFGQKSGDGGTASTSYAGLANYGTCNSLDGYMGWYSPVYNNSTYNYGTGTFSPHGTYEGSNWNGSYVEDDGLGRGPYGVNAGPNNGTAGSYGGTGGPAGGGLYDATYDPYGGVVYGNVPAGGGAVIPPPAPIPLEVAGGFTTGIVAQHAHVLSNFPALGGLCIYPDYVGFDNTPLPGYQQLTYASPYTFHIMKFYWTATGYTQSWGSDYILRSWVDGIPNGVSNLPITGVPSNHILIHNPTRYAYGVCLYAIPSNYTSLCATAAAAYAIDHDREKYLTAILSKITIKLNNFASSELMASIHEPGEFAVMPYVTPEHTL